MTIHTLQGIAGVLAVHQAVLAALICSIGRDAGAAERLAKDLAKPTPMAPHLHGSRDFEDGVEDAFRRLASELETIGGPQVVSDQLRKLAGG